MRLKHSRFTLCLLLQCFGALFAASAGMAAPARVVSTFLCTDEYVFRLVPKERIAALSFLAADTHPIVSTIQDRVGGITLIRPDTETVLRLKPDLVVMYQGTNARLHAHLAQIGTPILDIPWANSLAEVEKITTQLGEKLGAPEKAAAMLKQMHDNLARARAVAVHPPVRTLIYEPNGYATVGGMTEDVLAAAGLSNMAKTYHVGRTGAISVEAVLASHPELLLLSGQVARSRADLMLRHPALKAMPADTLVRWTSLTPLLCPGPWSASVAEPLARLGREASASTSKRAVNQSQDSIVTH